METTPQRNILISIIVTVLVCLLIGLSFFTWELSREVATMRDNMSAPGSSSTLALADSTVPTPPAATTQPQSPTPSTPGTQHSVPGSADPLAAPFSDPFARNWPGFMDPGGQIAEMQRRMDELMNSMTQGFPFFNQQDFGFGFIDSGPTIRMTEDSESYQVSIEVPEGQEVELNTELNNNTLVVSGSVRNEREESSSGLSSRSMQESRFSQSVYLPGPIDASAMRVEQEDTQIVVTVPKA